jgi:uncharacterized protein YozE (UPF0346 family)
MHKTIKIFVKSIGWILLTIILLVFLVFFLLNTPYFQDKLTETVLEKVELHLGNNIDFTSVKIKLFNKVEFEDLLITDLESDTIVFAPKMQAGVPGLISKVLFQKNAPLTIGSLDFDKSYFRLYSDSTGTINIQFIVDKIKAGKDTTKPSKGLAMHKIKVSDSRFVLSKFNPVRKDYGIEFSNMVFSELNFTVKDLKVMADTVKMDIKKLSFLEKSGFYVNNFESYFMLGAGFLNFKECNIQTKTSQINFPEIAFDFNTFKDFGNDFFNLVRLKIESDNSKINTLDIAYFAFFFREMDQDINLTGSFYGHLSNLNARNLDLSFGQNSSIKGNFDLFGLPDISSTFLMFDIDELVTTIEDMNQINLPNEKKINLPQKLNTITEYKYKGNFTGFFRDFVSYGTLETNLGLLNTDVLFRPDTADRVTFRGQLSSKNFNVGAFTANPEMIGNISLDLNIDGFGRIDKSFDVDIEGDIYEFEVNGYNYQAIKVDGEFSDKRFNGILNIDDPNAKVNFDGLVDLSSEIRRYIFTANVLHTNLFNLNIHKNDSNYIASFLMNANLSGNKLDEINGEVKLLNSLFAKTDAQIQVYDLNLSIRNDSVLNKLDLKSDFMNGSISGQYKLSQLPGEYLNLLNQYLPAFFTSNGEGLSSYSDFNYELEFKNSQPVFNFFLPEYMLYPSTKIQGKLIRNGTLYSKFTMQSPQIMVKNSSVKNAMFYAETDKNGLGIELGCENINLNDRIEFENFTVESAIDSNLANFELRWMNWDSSLQRGVLPGKLAFYNKPGQRLSGKVELDSSKIAINDSLWALNPFELTIDSNRVDIQNFKLSHNDEYILANGSLNNTNPNDSIVCEFQSFDFSNLNAFTKSSSVMFGGILNGSASITGFTKPLFFAKLFITDLLMNNEQIGNTKIDTYWNDEKQSVAINADIFRGRLNTLNITGDLFPARKNELDLLLKLDKLKLDFMNPYLSTIFGDITGNASGVLTLKGTAREPYINGDLNLQRTALTINYLKTRYNFTTKMGISNNNLIFNNVEINDVNGSIAMLNGVIHTEFFKKYRLNLSVDAKKFQFMNTTLSDNEMFYGTAYASGLVRINGEPESLKFDVAAKTEPGTQFNIPLSDSDELEDYNFIKYVDSDTAEAKVDNEYNVNLMGMLMDFNLKITPDAKVKMIFDPTVGDEIVARGNGEVRVVINTLGDFKIIGEYIIEEGDYLFTLQNVINRKFKVEKGSSVRWSGDPVNADINIDTYYRTKASLADLNESFEVEGASKKTVDCKLKLTGKLMQPMVGYDIYLPLADQSERDKVKSRINTDEEKGKQFLSLLIINRFLYAGSGRQESSGIGTENIAGVNASELFSNQVSMWLSQISNDFDINFNYRPGTEISSSEIELMFETQLLNDRMTINGGVDMKTNADVEQASAFVGDVDIDYKITKNGRLRARMFNRGNEAEQIVQLAPYTQGLGVFYTEEFDSFGEVFRNIRDSIFNRDKKKNGKRKKKTSDKAVLREENE